MPTRLLQLVALVIAVVLGAAPQLAHAAECSTTQLSAIRALDANATEVCGTSLLSFSAASAICTKPACLAYVMSLEAQVPYCDIQGINLRTIFSFTGSFCAQQSNKTDAVSFTRTPSSRASSTRAPMALVLTAVLLSAVATVR